MFGKNGGHPAQSELTPALISAVSIRKTLHDSLKTKNLENYGKGGGKGKGNGKGRGKGGQFGKGGHQGTHGAKSFGKGQKGGKGKGKGKNPRFQSVAVTPTSLQEEGHPPEDDEADIRLKRMLQSHGQGHT